MIKKQTFHQQKPSNVAFESPPSNCVRKAELNENPNAPHKPLIELRFEGSPIVRQKNLESVRKRLDFT